MESEEEIEKRVLIEHALENPKTNVKVWRNLAISPFGLVAGKCLSSISSELKEYPWAYL